MCCCSRAVIIIPLIRQPTGRTAIDNEELVQNQETISKKLIEFCDLEWENQCLEFHKNKRQVRTASIEQVRQPMNSKSIGAWKKYENYLIDLKTTLK